MIPNGVIVKDIMGVFCIDVGVPLRTARVIQNKGLKPLVLRGKILIA